jgi:tripartite-type tricarboxylate transporter receptor subunit TctC
VPKAIVARLNTDLVKLLNGPSLTQRLAEHGVDAMSSTPAQFAAHIRSETVRWAKVVRAAGLVAE